jgi:FMN phosphatase YigB (HAD superfamily)
MRDYMGRSWNACLELFEQRLGRALPAAFEPAFWARLDAALSDELEPVPGIHDALARIATPTCVASSGRIDKMRVMLGQTGLWDRFEGRIFTAADVARAKPFPDLFLHAASHGRARALRRSRQPARRRGRRAACACHATRMLNDADALAAGAEVVDMREPPERLYRPAEVDDAIRCRASLRTRLPPATPRGVPMASEARPREAARLVHDDLEVAASAALEGPAQL